MTLFLGLFFAAIGGIFLFLGRRDHDPLYLLVGVALMVYPYFVSNVWLIILVGVALSALPFGRSRGWW